MKRDNLFKASEILQNTLKNNKTKPIACMIWFFFKIGLEKEKGFVFMLG